MGGMISQFMYAGEKLIACFTVTMLVTCLITTLVTILVLGIGIGYNYCFVDIKTKHRYVPSGYRRPPGKKVPYHPGQHYPGYSHPGPYYTPYPGYGPHPGYPGHHDPRYPGDHDPRYPGHHYPGYPGHYYSGPPDHYDPRYPGHHDPRYPGHHDPRYPGHYDPRYPGHHDPRHPGYHDPRHPGYHDPRHPGHHDATYPHRYPPGHPYHQPYAPRAAGDANPTLPITTTEPMIPLLKLSSVQNTTMRASIKNITGNSTTMKPTRTTTYNSTGVIPLANSTRAGSTSVMMFIKSITSVNKQRTESFMNGVTRPIENSSEKDLRILGLEPLEVTKEDSSKVIPINGLDVIGLLSKLRSENKNYTLHLVTP